MLIIMMANMDRYQFKNLLGNSFEWEVLDELWLSIYYDYDFFHTD